MNANAPAIHIDGIIIPVTPHPEHDYTLSTPEVAAGYGVSEVTLRRHKTEHSNELVEGKHFICVPNPNVTGVQNLNARHRGLKRGNDTLTHWTKRGIIRLGFFIKSDRAQRFRDLAEDLILRETTAPVTADLLAEVRALRDEVALLRSQARRNEALLLSATAAGQARARIESADPDRVDTARLVAYLTEHVGQPVKFADVIGIASQLRLFRSRIVPYRQAATRSALGKTLTKYAGEVFRLPDGRDAMLMIWGQFRNRRYFADVVDPCLS